MKFHVPLKENHEAVWLWLHKNPWNFVKGRVMTKEDWPAWDTLDRKVRFNLIDVSYHEWKGTLFATECFACLHAEREREKEEATGAVHIPGICNFCPCFSKTEPNETGAYCLHENSLFDRWDESKDPKERSRLAKQIAELWREVQ